MAVSWWASSLSPFMAWLQHSEHLSICGLCAGAGAGWRGPSQSAALSLSLWLGIDPDTVPPLSHLSPSPLLQPSGTGPGLHLIPAPTLPGHSIIWIWPSADYFPWLTKHTRILSPGWRESADVAGIIYPTHAPVWTHRPGRSRALLCHCLLWLMSAYLDPGSRGMRPRTRCDLVNLLKSHNHNISPADTDTHHLIIGPVSNWNSSPILIHHLAFAPCEAPGFVAEFSSRTRIQHLKGAKAKTKISFLLRD